MSDIGAFLTARLDAEEQAARAAIERNGLPRLTAMGEPGVWPNPCSHGAGPYPPSHDLCARLDGPDITIYDEGGHSAEQAIHIAAQDPQATLDRVAALRAVVAMHVSEVYGYGETAYDACRNCESPWPCPTLRALASAWRRHPEWREEWAPETATTA